MKDRVLFIQGGGKAVHDQWDHRMVEHLERELGPEYEIRYPRMPHEADPKYSDWKAVLKQQFAHLDEALSSLAIRSEQRSCSERSPTIGRGKTSAAYS